VSSQRLDFEPNVWELGVSISRLSSSNLSFELSMQAVVGVRGVLSSPVFLLPSELGKKNKARLPRKKIKDRITYKGKLAVQT
jgi:hypothetical protein